MGATDPQLDPLLNYKEKSLFGTQGLLVMLHLTEQSVQTRLWWLI